MSYVGKVTANGSNHPIGSTLVGACSTAASTAAKVVELADFDELMQNITIRVKFTNSNTASNPTLNVNNTGAIPIRTTGSYAPGTSALLSWEAGSIISFTYTGSAWQMNDYNGAVIDTLINHTQRIDSEGTLINNKILQPSTRITVPSGSSGVTKTLTGLTANYRLIRWNFYTASSGGNVIPENTPPASMEWSTTTNSFTLKITGPSSIYSTAGATTVYCQPEFEVSTAVSAT